MVAVLVEAVLIRDEPEPATDVAAPIPAVAAIVAALGVLYVDSAAPAVAATTTAVSLRTDLVLAFGALLSDVAAAVAAATRGILVVGKRAGGVNVDDPE